MGKGDRKSFKGKLFKGSFGNSRPQRKKISVPAYIPAKKEKIMEAAQAAEPEVTVEAPEIQPEAAKAKPKAPKKPRAKKKSEE